MPATKTTILFDQMTIQISMYKAAVDTDLQLHEYHIDDKSRVGRKTVCTGCGAELTAEDIVKGCEDGGGPPVLLTRDELKALKSDLENAIRVLYTVPSGGIPLYIISAAYFAIPVSGGERPFETFRSALLETQLAAVGIMAAGGIETPAAVIAWDDGLLVIKLCFASDIYAMEKTYKKPSPERGDLEPVISRLNGMRAPFDLSVFRNTYQDRLRRLIISKLNVNRQSPGS